MLFNAIIIHMEMPSRVIRIIVISLLSLVAFLVIALIVLFSIKDTRFMMIKAMNRKQPINVRVKAYEKFLEKNPDFVPALARIAESNAYFSIRYPDEPAYLNKAVESYERILELQPDNVETMKELGDLYQAKGDLDKAESLYKKLIETDPYKASYRLKLARNYNAAKNIDAAFEETKKALKYSPKDANAHLMAGILYDEKEEGAQAIAEYKKAIQYFNEKKRLRGLMETYLRLGRLYLKNNLLYDAIQQYEKIVTLRLDPVAGQLELANVYLQVGLFDKAIDAIMNSLLNPSVEYSAGVNPFQKALSYRILAFAYLRKSDFIASHAYFRKAEALGMQFDPSLLKTVGRLAITQQDKELPAGPPEGYEPEIDETKIYEEAVELEDLTPDMKDIEPDAIYPGIDVKVDELDTDKVLEELEKITGESLRKETPEEATGIVVEEVDVEKTEEVYKELEELTEEALKAEQAPKEEPQEDQKKEQ